jgi:hypothetical protein
MSVVVQVGGTAVTVPPVTPAPPPAPVPVTAVPVTAVPVTALPVTVVPVTARPTTALPATAVPTVGGPAARPAPAGPLAFTGADPGAAAAVALGLVVLGILLVRRARRVRPGRRWRTGWAGRRRSVRPASGHGTDDQGVALAATTAQRSGPEATTAATELEEQGQRQAVA